jgi:hypothetical protein
MDDISPWPQRLIQDDQGGCDRQQDEEAVMPASKVRGLSI